MPLYQPQTGVPGMSMLTQMVKERISSSVQRNIQGTRRRPQQPRNLIAQSGSLIALVNWNAPLVVKGIVGWRFYRDNENNLIDDVRDPGRRQYKVPLPANKTTMVYISSITQQGVESQKVGIMISSNTDQLVTTGTAGGTNGTSPSNPPGWQNELTGGQLKKLRLTGG